MTDVNSFNNSFNNIEKMITYVKDKSRKSKKKYQKYKMLSTLSKSFGILVIIVSTSSSNTLSLTAFGILAIPKSGRDSVWIIKY